MASDRPEIIAVVGPTASGKTRRAVELARALDGEIVSADSRQVYRGMDLGTGKDIEEYGDVPYHLIDICEAGEKYNLFRFLEDYNRVRDSIAGRGRAVVLCGGSGMYVEAALNGLSMPKVGRDEKLRSELEGKSLGELTAILASMKTLHNTTDIDTVQRAVRAIEIQTYYQRHPELKPVPGDPGNRAGKAVVIGIDIPRDKRRERITWRLKSRLEAGMVEEVKGLLAGGLEPEQLIYYGLEYKWLTLYVTGQISYSEMFTGLETAIHQFAKRQMTWLRGMEKRGHRINWVPYDIDSGELVSQTLKWLGR